VASFQNTRFKLAELATEVQVAPVFVDKCIQLLIDKQLDITGLECKVMDQCVQLHGGYGYMWEFPIARAYVDARVRSASTAAPTRS
jgi:long-chain-acyl-CoA dehydrogenase